MVENVNGAVHGIVLAGAHRSHSALDRLVPRPLLPVAQQPLVTFALRWMRGGGLRDVSICTNSAARAIQSSLNGSAAGLNVSFLEDWTPRGAAGCVRDAGVRTEAGTFVVADGTAVPGAALRGILEAHREADAALTVAVAPDATARLQPTGVYVFDRRVLEHIPPDSFQDIKERLIPRLHGVGEHVATYTVRSAAPRVVNADSYLALNHWAVERAATLVDLGKGFVANGESVVHATARVDPTARLLGPVLIGPGVEIRAGATVVGPVTIGHGTTVGRGAVVSRSVVWGGCRLGDESFVDRSLLADGVCVEAHKQVFAAAKLGRRDDRSRGWMPSGAWEPGLPALSPATSDGQY